MPERATVVVCRTPDQAGTLVDALRDAGFDPVPAPVIAIDEPADGGAALRGSVSRIDDVDLVVLTSPNAVRAIVSALTSCGHAIGVWSELPVAAVGPGTAAAARAAGFRHVRCPARNVAEGLLEELATEHPGAGRILLPQAAAARRVLRDTLAARGWRVDATVAYRTVAVALEPSQAAAVRTAAAVAFTSSSTVGALVAAVGLDGIPQVVASIGPQTTRTARSTGLAVAAEAQPHTIPGLVAAVAAALGRRRNREGDAGTGR